MTWHIPLAMHAYRVALFMIICTDLACCAPNTDCSINSAHNHKEALMILKDAGWTEYRRPWHSGSILVFFGGRNLGGNSGVGGARLDYIGLHVPRAPQLCRLMALDLGYS